jgi:hypothetical protein
MTKPLAATATLSFPAHLAPKEWRMENYLEFLATRLRELRPASLV